ANGQLDQIAANLPLEVVRELELGQPEPDAEIRPAARITPGIVEQAGVPQDHLIGAADKRRHFQLVFERREGEPRLDSPIAIVVPAHAKAADHADVLIDVVTNDLRAADHSDKPIEVEWLIAP